MLFGQLVLLSALVGSAASAAQLPGWTVLGSFNDITQDGRAIRNYQNQFLPSNAFFNTAALISNTRAGEVPACGYAANNRVWTWANLHFNHEFRQRQKISGTWVTVVTWRRCTNSTQYWSPTGQQLVLTEYAGTYRPTMSSTRGSWEFWGNLTLPRGANPQPFATEWTVFN
jgi:hypothetical protein